MEKPLDRRSDRGASEENWRLGLGSLWCRVVGEVKNKTAEQTEGSGLYALIVEAPDAPKWSSDASGAHQTKTQRGLKFARASNDGHQTLA